MVGNQRLDRGFIIIFRQLFPKIPSPIAILQNDDTIFSMHDVSLIVMNLSAPTLALYEELRHLTMKLPAKGKLFGLNSCLGIISNGIDAKVTERHPTYRLNATGMVVHTVGPLYESLIWVDIKGPSISNRRRTCALSKFVHGPSTVKKS